MADRDRTLAVAVAGIAATAVVGLAGTTTAWLSARSDRAAQRDQARDDRTYDRRVAAYLDAVDYLERSNEAFESIEQPTDYEFVLGRTKIPYQETPPTRLTSRIGAFGSPDGVKAFEKAQGMKRRVPNAFGTDESGNTYLDPVDYWWVKRSRGGLGAGMKRGFVRRLAAFRAQLDRFEAIVHEEIG